MRTGRVVVVGDALIDGIRDAVGTRDAVGGAALNVAVGLSRLGVPATLIAMVADDPDGALVRAYLEQHGVRLVATEAPLGTARAEATKTAEGEATYLFNDAAVRRRIVFGGEAAAVLDDAPLVVVSCYPFDRDEPTADLLAAVEDAEQRLIVDPNPRPALLSDPAAFVRNLEEVARRARLVKVGDEDAALLWGEPLEQAAARLAAIGTPMVLATAGRAGAFLRAGDTRVDAGVADLPGPIVDTIGAGDATLAAIVDAVLRADVQGLADALYWDAALQNAMTIAAATCRGEGALLQLP